MSSPVFVDLAASNQAVLKLQCDVCVVGAGAAGIYLAVQLASKGMDVVLLEAGNINCSDATTAGFAAQFEKEIYPGATVGRFFGIGGSTSHWGGLLIPHTRHDLRGAPDAGFNPWRHIVQTVSAKATTVLTRLGWYGGADFSTYSQEKLGAAGNSLRAAGFDVAASLFLPFRYKNLVFLLRHSRARVIFNAVARNWVVEPGSAAGAQLKQLQAVSANDNRLEISAARFVVAAGAIESARVLLELNDSASLPVIRRSAATGCFLSDHLSLPIADVATSSLDEAISLFAPRFANGWMRGYRFMEAEPPAGAPRAFLHFVFENKNPGFALAKEILQAMQGRRWPSVSVTAAMFGTAELLGLGYKRYVQSVLHIPSGTPTHLQLDIEQEAVRDNWIKLGAEMDRYGRRVAKINWETSNRDIENIHATAQRVLNKWPGKRAGLPELLPKIEGSQTAKPHDAYHPVATCRMGTDLEAVVDENMKVWGVENLWVVSTGVLPSAGTANPTFTMLCLAEGLVDHLTANTRSTESAGYV